MAASQGIGGVHIDLTANVGKFERDLRAAQAKVKGFADKGGKNFNRFRKQTDSTAASILNLQNGLRLLSVVGFAGFAASVKSAISVAANFEQSIADLSAITGATGKDLEFLSDKAREFGATTTLSASQAAVAFKIVASAKPDLLENRDALAAVTREVITLAEAASTDLPNAAKALTGSLNQFNKGAEEAARFINVLAAGSKYGSSEITETAEALDKVGVIAAQAGLSFEQTNAALQVLAKGNIKASDAGTALRNVLLRLKKTGKDEFNPTLVGLSQALQNVSDAGFTDIEMMKLFEVRTLGAAQEMIQFLPLLGELETKLTDTNVAYEQAATKTNTLVMDVKALASAFAELQLQLGDKTTPSMRELVQGMTDFLRDSDRVKEAGLLFAAALGAVALQAIAARLAVSGFVVTLTSGIAVSSALTLSMDALNASVLRLLTRLGPLAALYGATWVVMKVYSDNAAQAARATELFTEFIKPNREEIERLGISLDNLDPTNLNSVLEVIRNAKAGGVGITALLGDVLSAEVGQLYDATVDELVSARKSVDSVHAKLAAALAAGQTENVETLQGILAIEEQRVADLVDDLTALNEKIGALGAAAGGEGPIFERVRAPEAEAAPTADSGLSDAEREALDSRLSALQLSLGNESDAVEAAYHARNELIREGLAEQVLTQLEADALFISSRIDRESKLSAIEKKGWTERQKFAAMSSKAQVKHVLGSLAAITAGTATSNKKMFQVNKLAGIGNAIVNTSEAITLNLAKFPGPLGIAMAGIAAAAGIAQVQAIRSTSFGGGTTPSFAGTMPSVGGTPVEASIPQTDFDQTRTANIVIHADGALLEDQMVSLPASALRELAEQMTDVSGDMDVQISFG